MPVRSITTLKSWFQRGMYPLASQFADWMDSYWHKEDAISLTSVDGLPELLNAKYNTADGHRLETRVQSYETSLDEHKADDAAEIAKIYKTFEEIDDDIERIDKRVTDEVARLDGQKVGSSSIRNIAGPMTADEYAALTPDAETLYIITD